MAIFVITGANRAVRTEYSGWPVAGIPAGPYLGSAPHQPFGRPGANPHYEQHREYGVRMRTRSLVAALAAVTVTMLAGGCGTGGSARMRTEPMSMAGMQVRSAPSATARMICSAEIRHAVQRTFVLSSPPPASSTWTHRMFGCTYDLPNGSLRLTVDDASDRNVGRSYFTGLRSQLDGSATIHGAEALGFPAFETRDGNVVFLKDGKTLRVDASTVPRRALPTGFSREEAAYAVAAAVIACWQE
jgi:hypothetical protein